jgi:hypothetical protein
MLFLLDRKKTQYNYNCSRHGGATGTENPGLTSFIYNSTHSSRKNPDSCENKDELVSNKINAVVVRLKSYLRPAFDHGDELLIC